MPGRGDPEIVESAALLGRARAGEPGAWDAWISRYQDRVYRIVRVRLGPHLRVWTESGDLVQETLRAALVDLARPELESDIDLLDRLARIATNRIRDLDEHLHAQRRDVRRARPLAPEDDADSANGQREAGALADSRTAVPERAFLDEVRELLDRTVAGLPADYREVILLRDYHGASWEAVARVLGRTSIHATQQLHQRAWIKVRALAAPQLADLREA